MNAPIPVTPATVSAPPQRPLAKNWSLVNLRLPREELIEAINGAANVPASAKAMLVDGVQSLDPNVRLAALDAHARYLNGLLVLTVSIKPL